MGGANEKTCERWTSRFECFQYPDFFLGTSFVLRGNESKKFHEQFHCSCSEAGVLTVKQRGKKVDFVSAHSSNFGDAELQWQKMSSPVVNLLQIYIPKELALETNAYLRPQELLINATFSDLQMSELHAALSRPDNVEMIKWYGDVTSSVSDIFRKFAERKQKRISGELFSCTLCVDHDDSYLALRIPPASNRGVDIYDYGEIFSDFKFGLFDFQLIAAALVSLNRMLDTEIR
jgi:hypothetical protein